MSIENCQVRVAGENCQVRVASDNSYTLTREEVNTYFRRDNWVMMFANQEGKGNSLRWDYYHAEKVDGKTYSTVLYTVYANGECKEYLPEKNRILSWTGFFAVDTIKFDLLTTMLIFSQRKECDWTKLSSEYIRDRGQMTDKAYEKYLHFAEKYMQTFVLATLGEEAGIPVEDTMKIVSAI